MSPVLMSARVKLSMREDDPLKGRAVATCNARHQDALWPRLSYLIIYSHNLESS